MGFLSVSKVVTLNDLERRMTVILHHFTEFDSFGADYVKIFEDRPISYIVCDKNVAQRIFFGNL